ncbi:hypothetical protein chiPu_0002413 [Chiloscyllium punctatum]|uniref:Uncharacterized protein n=1 Tax=Chiloscyllium punctatum TaxID=137246 RepID=A0A401S0V9_CHIPU|nr:hypothetical protein [Chiloscyllium punctatum]
MACFRLETAVKRSFVQTRQRVSKVSCKRSFPNPRSHIFPSVGIPVGRNNSSKQTLKRQVLPIKIPAGCVCRRLVFNN